MDYQINYFNTNTISKFLNGKKIPNTIINNQTVETNNLQITPAHIINKQTGELIITIPENDSILDYLEYIPSIEKSAEIENNNI